MEDKYTEFEGYDAADLELIINEQRDLYSEEELDRAKEVLERKRLEEASSKNAEEASLSDSERMLTLFCICSLVSPVCGIILCIGVGIMGSSRLHKRMKSLVAATIVSLILRAFLAYGGIMPFI